MLAIEAETQLWKLTFNLIINKKNSFEKKRLKRSIFTTIIKKKIKINKKNWKIII